MKRIAVDAMGGDHGAKVIVPAALQVLSENPDLYLIFVGQKNILEPALAKRGADLKNRFEIYPASEVVEMDELPSAALRGKKDSSMRVAIDLVKDGKAEACVSAGNTGALMATARFVLKTLPGVDRPAIMTRFPTRSGHWVRVLDLGANVDSTAEQLYQFGAMGSAVAAAVENLTAPRVALINIGQEEMKGNEQVRQTAALFEASPHINYTGFIEGDAIFKGVADVVVCDGFVGNVMLKSCEGIMKFFSRTLKEEFKRNWLTKLSALCAYPVLSRVKNRFDPRHYNGASFLGLNGIVIKSHGGADQVAFAAALKEAMIEVDKKIPERIRDQVSHLLSGVTSA